MLITEFGLTALAVLLFGYVVAVRPWHLQWGASHLDRVARLPGDELSPHSPNAITRAIAVHAPPPAVWQAVEHIAKERARHDGMLIAIEHEPQALVLVSAADLPRIKAGDEAVDATRAFFLKPLPDGTTRVIARLREAAFPGAGARAANFLFREVAHFFAERRLLLAVKQAAESQRPH